MKKNLIIKLGALGDVVRTTSLLRVWKGEITWVTKANALPLIKGNPFIRHTFEIKEAMTALRGNAYDTVLNLDEDEPACRLASMLKKSELIGPYEIPGGRAYTKSSAPWFDMGLISRFGKKEADRKKGLNRTSYQEILFAMVGKKFKGEEYILPSTGKSQKSRHKRPVVGIEMRSGERWTAKRWPRFPEFLKLLEKRGIPYRKFYKSPTLIQFIRQIDQTDVVVTTDSLALHIALGLRKKTVALFNCTSPHEIYGYGRLTKMVSPLLGKYFYSTAKTMEPGAAIAPADVFKAIEKWVS